MELGRIGVRIAPDPDKRLEGARNLGDFKETRLGADAFRVAHPLHLSFSELEGSHRR
jgi:hypothetical protein